MPPGLPRRLVFVAAGLVAGALSGCAQLPTVAASDVPAVAPQRARIWIYRDLQQSAIPEVPQVRLSIVSS